VDFLCAEPKPFSLLNAQGANNHIEQNDAFFFARDPIGVTYNELLAMLTNTIHIFPSGARNMPYQIGLLMRVRIRKGIFGSMEWREFPSFLKFW
jgi:hypothetical protein